MSKRSGPAPLATRETGPEKSAATKPPILAVESTGRVGSSVPSTHAALSAALRDYGVAQANNNADPWWRDCFDRAVDYLASTRREFTSDDIFAEGVPAPDHPNRVGARINAAHKAGLIRPVGYRLSTRPSRHAGVVRVWVGGEATA